MIFPGEEARVTANFEDYAGEAYDPSSRDWKIYDSTNTLIDTKDEGDDVYGGEVGSYYLDYLVPSSAELGRWRCMIVGDDKGVTKQTWIVRGETWPSVQDVYDNLAGMEPARVSTETAEECILKAVLEIDLEKSSEAAVDLYSQAYLVVSMYHVYVAYVTEVERSIGMVPMPVLLHLGELKDSRKQWIAYCRRGVGQDRIGPVKSETATLVPDSMKAEWPE